MADTTFDDFLHRQLRRVRRALGAPNHDADFVEEAEVLTISTRGNTKGHMGRRCPSADGQEGKGGTMPGKRRREVQKEDRPYWDYYKPPTTGSRFPWK